MNKSAASAILEKTEKARKRIILKRQKVYFRPFFNAKKVWARTGAEYVADFAIDIDTLIKGYQKSCLKAIDCKNLFITVENVEKAKKYKTWEYLDKRYNRVVVDDIKDTLVTLKTSFQSALKSSYEKYITNGNVKDSAELVYQDMDLEFNFNMFDKSTSKYLKEKAIKWSKTVAESTEQAIKSELVKGYEAGLSVYDIADNIKKATGFNYKRAETIARTEVISSCNYADYTAALKNPNVIGNEWSATGDSRTRPTHKAADGQKRKKGEPFNVGGYKLMYPGDSSLGAPAKEVINCRCTLFAVFKGEELGSHTVYDDKDAETKEWLLRQSQEFQEEYLGGKAKARLFKANLLDIADREKSIREILDKLYPIKLKYKDMSPISSLPEKAIEAVVTNANVLWLYGKMQNKESNVTLDAVTGKKVCKNVLGEYGKITTESENYNEWIRYLDKAKENSVILIHNHNNVSSISFDDLQFFLKRKAVMTMFVVDSSGNLYFIEKQSGMEYNFVNLLNTIKSELKTAYEKAMTFKMWNDFNGEQQIEYKRQMYEAVIGKCLRKAGVIFGQYKR